MKPSQIQPRDDLARRIAERHERTVATQVSAGITALRASIDEATLARAIETNDWDRLWRHLALDRMPDMLRPALNGLAWIHDRLAQETMAEIDAIFKAGPSKLKTPAVIPLTYDPLASQTVQRQRDANEQIVEGVEDAAQQTARQVVSDGLAARMRPAAIARRLRETLGMTIQEANAIENYRGALEQGSAAALARALRDRRYDARVRRGEPLEDDQIETMVARYAERYRAFRAERIARTETLRAANQGRLEAYRQWAEMTGRGDEIRRFWLTAADELVCKVCRPIPDMNPQGIALNEQYATPIGPQDQPPIHPNCRCTEKIVRSVAR
jgi:hypothetical protein